MNPNKPIPCQKCGKDDARISLCDVGMEIKCKCGRIVHAASTFQVVRAWFGLDGTREMV